MAKSPHLSQVLEALPQDLLPADLDKARELIDFLFTHGLSSEKRMRDFLVRRDYHALLEQNNGQRTLTRQEVGQKWDMTAQQVYSILRATPNLYS